MVESTTFEYFRTIFITFTIIMAVLFILVMLNRGNFRLVNGFSIFSITAISILVSGLLLYTEGILVDELGLGGDPAVFYLFISIVLLGMGSMFLYLHKSTKQERI
ncbi:MAG: hypothetical protein ACQEV7_13890 [Bacillota bacterium]